MASSVSLIPVYANANTSKEELFGSHIPSEVKVICITCVVSYDKIDGVYNSYTLAYSPT